MSIWSLPPQHGASFDCGRWERPSGAVFNFEVTEKHLLAADKCGPFSCGLEQVKKLANYEVCFGHGRIVWNDKWRTVVSRVMNRCGS